ncbi:hypothetical protein Q5P01_004935 [Channa striata]|uniref:t-SNARE coiled-coil homology domain-containing protein n=1 Tax=Channa striata TaxID=64152 RepID=A0AA88NMT2_CHASR|nr:hypothetical protein Q5P01_004935 [Channa striata]
MRDMLEKLRAISGEQDSLPEFYDSVEVATVNLSQQTVVYENSSIIEDLLMEAHSIRKNISLLQLEVERLTKHNERFSTTVRRLTLLKKGSDSIARGIQQRAEALYSRLQSLGKKRSQLEESKGSHSAVTRIAQIQYQTLTQSFHNVMAAYNQAEEMQRIACRERIQRQASILGTEISAEELDELVSKGGEGWGELSQNLQTQGAKSTHWALHEIKGRHKELVELEARMTEIRELFLDIAMLVEEQGSMLNNIEANVHSAEDHVEESTSNLKKAYEYKKKHPCWKCCCCCCPCLPS